MRAFRRFATGNLCAATTMAYVGLFSGRTDDRRRGTEEDARLRLAYDEGFRALAQQRDDLEKLRARVVALVSVGSLAVGIVGTVADTLSQGHSRWLYAGLAAFGVLVVAACLILAPHTVTFDTDPRVLLKDYVDTGRDLNATLRWSAHYAGENAEKNNRVLKWLHRYYLGAVIALGLATAAFAVAVLTGTG